ncbi:hypothetical protein EDC56_1522 [Sinobacterium caligoides]|uniref:Uncharacterized protein n=1 Tax=Sinobacterium caligoides TaxID=933926 RepID=A0A3N2DMQ1_9GAMM|nr:hypothetical protein [Sinobacterium caligoides]ROS01096.1 hypothetical protein EDC56_1522 [Sinobacterium caligoides]
MSILVPTFISIVGAGWTGLYIKHSTKEDYIELKRRFNSGYFWVIIIAVVLLSLHSLYVEVSSTAPVTRMTVFVVVGNVACLLLIIISVLLKLASDAAVSLSEPRGKMDRIVGDALGQLDKVIEAQRKNEKIMRGLVDQLGHEGEESKATKTDQG